jgi:hypothetical protein
VHGQVGKDADMTVRKKERGGKLRWVIEIPYQDRRTRKRIRFRRDAQVQTSQAAHAEDRRLIAQLEELGYIPTGPVQQEEAAQPEPRCFRIGADAPTEQALAGHRHLSVTQRYALTNEVAKRKVIENLSLAS